MESITTWSRRDGAKTIPSRESEEVKKKMIGLRAYYIPSFSPSSSDISTRVEFRFVGASSKEKRKLYSHCSSHVYWKVGLCVPSVRGIVRYLKKFAEDEEEVWSEGKESPEGDKRDTVMNWTRHIGMINVDLVPIYSLFT
tara:strand:- start:246 stop:665 length:420 start_codon:yes stop_codon:yes gene_type:complete